MLDVAILVASLAFAGLVGFAIPVLLQLRRTARAAESALTTIEREMRPLTAELQALLIQHRALAEGATRDLREVERLVSTASGVVGRVARVSELVGGLGMVGKVLTVALGVRKGAGVFVDRVLRR